MTAEAQVYLVCCAVLVVALVVAIVAFERSDARNASLVDRIADLEATRPNPATTTADDTAAEEQRVLDTAEFITEATHEITLLTSPGDLR